MQFVGINKLINFAFKVYSGHAKSCDKAIKIYKKYKTRFFKSANLFIIPSILIWEKRRILYTVCKESQTYKLPTYTKDEVSVHNSPDSRIWVSYERKVYDITDFIENHPGGNIITQAAGKPLEIFFNKYSFHLKFNIHDFIDQYLIGELAENDWYEKSTDVATEAINDDYTNDPIRDPSLLIVSDKPFNAETPTELLIENFITPNHLFFVRNHHPVPLIDPYKYDLSICFQNDFLNPDANKSSDYYYKSTFIHNGEEEECLCHDLTLEEMKDTFKNHEVTTTIQCSGNLRSEMHKEKSVQGLNWRGGAISNAKWTGVKVKDILKECGLKDYPEYISADGHVRCSGSDHNPTTKENYEISIPLSMALDPDALLAFYMNNENLPSDHGFPLRLIVPGVCGARNVKWVKMLLVTDEESKSKWQQEDYRCYSPDKKDRKQVKRLDVPPIYQTPIMSLICKPADGSSIQLTKSMEGVNYIELEGYAYSGGGRGVSRVEVSIDGGNDWHPAVLTTPQSTLPHRTFSWTFWKAKIPVPLGLVDLDVVCKAVDVSYNHQPESPLPIWNMRGLLNNSWHNIHVNIVD